MTMTAHSPITPPLWHSALKTLKRIKTQCPKLW
jgi:hypothetical protein